MYCSTLDEKNGMLVKGTFGPWQGAFGNKYSVVDVTLRNYCGLIAVKQNKDHFGNRFVHKLLPDVQFKAAERICPMFIPVFFRETESFIEFIWEDNQKTEAMFAIPALCEIDAMALEVDGHRYELYKNMHIRNQYRWVREYQSKMTAGNKWVFKIQK